MLGIGDIADRCVPVDQCVATIHRALDAGLNLIDTAPGYEDGYSEEIVGKALKGRREGVFVIDKVDHLDRPVGEQVDNSLKVLGMDHTDLFVFHGVSTLQQWQMLRAEGGGMQQLEDCRRAGKCRFKGISCHHPQVLLEAVASGLCDVVLFPVGPYVAEEYVSRVLPLARRHGVGTVCFKTFGAGKLLGDTSGYGRPLAQRPRGKFSSGGVERDDRPVLPHLSVEECLHYTLTCDPDVALLGMSFPNEQDAAFSAAGSFVPLNKDQMADIRRRAVEAIADKGPCWWNPSPDRV
jgi:aryl-alcohol dehydrogenase-like predicted oxidoreductase